MVRCYTMNELTKAWEWVPRTGIPNLRPASTLLQQQQPRTMTNFILETESAFISSCSTIMTSTLCPKCAHKGKSVKINVKFFTESFLSFMIWKVTKSISWSVKKSVQNAENICQNKIRKSEWVNSSSPGSIEASQVAILRCTHSSIWALHEHLIHEFFGPHIIR